MPNPGPGLFQTRSITVHGTYYKLDSNSILLAEMRDTLPTFGSISNIWMYDQRHVFFALNLFETVNYSVLQLMKLRKKSSQVDCLLLKLKTFLLVMSCIFIGRKGQCLSPLWKIQGHY